MIVGYQVQDYSGNHWGNRPSHKILTEETAIADLKEARSKSSTVYMMIVILAGDIEEPTFEGLGGLDLFDQHELQPPWLKAICDKYERIFLEGEMDSYKLCKEFLEEVKHLGFEFEYGLDGEPYGLHPIGSDLACNE